MIDVLAAEWDDASNPAGIGDLREVLRAALSLPEFLDPDRTRSKIKTPLEHFASAVRAVRGTTDGRGYMISYLCERRTYPALQPHSHRLPGDRATLAGYHERAHPAELRPSPRSHRPGRLRIGRALAAGRQRRVHRNRNEAAIVDFLTSVSSPER